MALADEQCTLIFFESPNRIKATIAAMSEVFGVERSIAVAREITKMHETFYRGSLGAVGDQFQAMDKVKGEIVIVLEGAAAESAATTQEAVETQLRTALQSMKTKQAAAYVAERNGLPKQELYRLALTLKDDQ